jgi:hypothetical protein
MPTTIIVLCQAVTKLKWASVKVDRYVRPTLKDLCGKQEKQLFRGGESGGICLPIHQPSHLFSLLHTKQRQPQLITTIRIFLHPYVTTRVQKRRLLVLQTIIKFRLAPIKRARQASFVGITGDCRRDLSRLAVRWRLGGSPVVEAVLPFGHGPGQVSCWCTC